MRHITPWIGNFTVASTLGRSRQIIAFVVAATGLLLTSPERAEAQHNLRLAVGEIGGIYYPLGVGLMSLVKVTLLHEQGIDLSLVEEPDPARRAGMIEAGEADLALLTRSDSLIYSSGGELGAIGQFTLQGEDGVLDEPISLVASNDLDAALIQDLTRVIVEEQRWLAGALPGLRQIPPGQSEGADIPWHVGALAYYVDLYPELAAVGEPIGRPDIFLIYFEDRDAALDESVKRQIDLACSHAAEHAAAEVIVSGPADMMSRDASGLQLTDAQAQAALIQLRARDGCRDVVIAQAPDGRTLAERYDPAVPVAARRRLEVGVILNR